MRNAWSIVITRFMEHCNENLWTVVRKSAWHIVMTRDMEYFSAKGMEH